MKERYASFYQSTLDFPCSVELGKNTPSFGINRWGNCAAKAACALRFVPPDDEGFSVRGDKRRLLYKGRQRSHRFTVHSDTSFEYDCILLKEPDSNTVSLRMEGAENFDFFRQPDFVRDPFLKGSFAVYKKETLIGEGTGKLCHIHRPLIIDALGRRCWGSLAVVGNELRITIPEKWLVEAKYPVTVDPTVGTSTVGSQTYWEDQEDNLMFDTNIGLNRFLISETINGLCTAFIYTNQDDTDAGGRPVFYTDNGNKPLNRRSQSEQLINFRVTKANAKGWRSGTFYSNSSITSGSYIWFGVYTEYIWFPRFDYGLKCYYNTRSSDVIPTTYPHLGGDYYDDIKLSMYFTYTSAQSYVRTLTEGVNLSDIRINKLEIKRNLVQTANANDARNLKNEFYRRAEDVSKISDVLNKKADFQIKKEEAINISDTHSFNIGFLRKTEQTLNVTDIKNHIGDFIRINSITALVNDLFNRKTEYKKEAFENVDGSTVLNGFVSFFRNCIEAVKGISEFSWLQSFFRFLNDDVKSNSVKSENRELNRFCEDYTDISDVSNRRQGFYRSVFDSIKNTDNYFFPVLFVRTVKDTQTVSDVFRQIGDYIRCLYVEAANMAETERSGEFYRIENDTANADGSVFRELFIFIKLVSTCFVRDFIIRRFLIAREELVLKSKITLELTIESKIN